VRSRCCYERPGGVWSYTNIAGIDNNKTVYIADADNDYIVTTNGQLYVRAKNETGDLVVKGLLDDTKAREFKLPGKFYAYRFAPRIAHFWRDSLVVDFCQ
jgi:hypothetical protein